jgi:hypothetical protein
MAPNPMMATELISAMITPALLILGSGSLVSTALVRLGRIVDRARALNSLSGDDRQRLKIDEATLDRWLETYRHRANLTEHSVRSFFFGVSLFVVACLSIAVDRLTGGEIFWLPVALTVGGMLCMLVGAALMVRECRLATLQAHAEIGAGKVRI